MTPDWVKKGVKWISKITFFSYFRKPILFMFDCIWTSWHIVTKLLLFASHDVGDDVALSQF